MRLRPVLRAIVFDFDGLILDTEQPIYQSWLEVYRAHGEELPFDRWMQIVGSNNAAFDPKANLEERLARALPQDVLDARLRRRTELVLEQAVRPGVAELAAGARAAGVRTGVASSSTRAWVEDHLARLGIDDRFECVRCRDDVKTVKPAPDLFLAVASCLDAAPAQSVAIEDSYNGVLAAKAAGMACIAVPNTITASQDFSRADLVVESLAGLTPQGLASKLGFTVFACASESSPAEETRPA